MVKEQELEKLFSRQENIRLVSVIAHVDHGKTTLTDSLLARAGLIDVEQAGNKRGTDTMEEEKNRGITIRSTGVTMAFEGVIQNRNKNKNKDKNENEKENENENERCILHLVDSPGHVDFSSEVTAALRVSDGAIVVVDCVEGVCVQTETVLRQALSERVKPILILNKIDRAILELKLDPEEAYQRFNETIAAVNKVMVPYSDSVLGDISFSPEKGNVIFASGLFGWGISLPQFARRLVSKNSKNSENSKVSEDRIVRNLWGDAFFDPDTKKIVYNSMEKEKGEKKLERYACKMFLGPLFKLIKAIMENEKTQIDDMLSRIDITLSQKEREEKTGKDLMRVIMRRFLPLADSLLDSIFSLLPSPLEAQKYRAEILYDGDMNDEYAKAIKECDPNGPLIAFISKMVPVPNSKNSFYSFGRVFSGTLSCGQKVFAIGNGSKKEEASKNVQRLIPMSIRSSENLDQCPCGNIIAIQGIDNLLIKSGTIASSTSASPIKNMVFSVSPIVRVNVSAKNAQDLPKLLEGLRSLVNVDPCVQCTTEKDQIILAAVGDLHLEVCMNILRNDYCKGIEILESPPMVPFRETILSIPFSSSLSSPSSLSPSDPPSLLAKSANKHNRIYVTASPLSLDLCEEIEKRKEEINMQREGKKREEILIRNGWDENEAKKKIWCFAPEGDPYNVIVDTTRAAQYLNDIGDSIVGAFKWACEEGPLCGEPLRGVRVNVTDVNLHSDSVHRNARQITPIVRRVTHACVLASSPRLVEPVYLVEVVVTNDEVGKVYNVMERKRGRVISEEPRIGTPMTTLKVYLPVLSSFGLTASLREATHGKAFAQASLSHWQIMDGDPIKEGTLPNQIVKEVRARKGMPPALPKWEDLVDKL